MRAALPKTVRAVVCSNAIGRFSEAIEVAARIRRNLSPTGPLVPMWEFVARIALREYASAEALLPMESAAFWFPAREILHAARGGETQTLVLPEEKEFIEVHDVSAYALLALGKVEQGLAFLNKHINGAIESGTVHWWSYRLPIYRHLFGEEVTQHPTYRQAIEALGLDAASRRALQDSVVARLSPITGIEPQTLLNI